MVKLISLAELLFKGMLASFLLFYSFEIQKHPQRFITTFQNNLQRYGHALGLEAEFGEDIGKYLLYYCQFLALVSLTIVCGMRVGKILGSLAIIANLLLCWSKIQLLFIGIHLIFIAIVL